ncbi:glycosyl hydrolase family 28-related protein [Pseudoxanthomonas sp.]|uniref:right-handed parallel beta-helix repeat-containing protein n=1 Tax=Pseudoxanthomonas sp. TaxID=1871049 RepID=UPI003F7E8DCF
MNPMRRNMLIGASVAGGALLVGSAGGTPAQGVAYGHNVTDYGADPTGVGDSTLAFQNAIAAATGNGGHGGLVLVPPGHYRLNSTIDLPSYLSLLGPGTPHSAILDFSGQTSGSALRVTGFGHVRVAGLAIMGAAAHGIEVTSDNPQSYKNFCQFSDLYVFESGVDGFHLSNTYMTTLERCWVKNAARFGFRCSGFHTSLKLDTCWADSCGNTGFNLNATVYSTLNNCGADSNQSYGYFLSNCQSISMTGCGAEGNFYSSVGLAATDGWAAEKKAAEGDIRGITISSFFSLEGNKSGEAAFGSYLTLYTEDSRLIEGSSLNHHARGSEGLAVVIKRGFETASRINFPVFQGENKVA